ncbi:MAG TPA: peptide deformylase [Steroidobacteraceae bacterium]|nr:peptide deformylase [Steroidobacteraceae bacterium]
MAIRTILRMGDPLLLQRAGEVTRLDTPELHQLIADMEDTMQHANGAGLAAPQIGVSERVVIFGFVHNDRYPDAPPVPYTVLINPLLDPLGKSEEEGWEGCLSVPGMRGLVPRHARLRYRGFDQFGNAIDRTVDGFHARVVQHEVDHLDGILYPMRIRDLTRFGFQDVLFPDQEPADA